MRKFTCIYQKVKETDFSQLKRSYNPFKETKTRSIALNRLCFNPIQLLWPAKLAVTNCQKSNFWPYPWRHQWVTFRYNITIYSEVSCFWLTTTVFGSGIGIVTSLGECTKAIPPPIPPLTTGKIWKYSNGPRVKTCMICMSIQNKRS